MIPTPSGPIKLTYLGLNVLFLIIKIYLTGKHTTNAANANQYPLKIGIFQFVQALTFYLPFLWVFGFLSFDLFELLPPLIVQIIGNFFLLLLIVAMIWQMKTLSVNISANHDQRYLVKNGPYQYVRHPLYLIFILIMIAGFLVSGNLIFMVASLINGIASKIRADYEEELLMEEYGQKYKMYAENTPQLFPKF